MRIKSTPNPLFRLFAFAATVFGSSLGFGQTTDLRIDFSGPQPQFVQVGSFFSIQGTISFDANGTTPVPAGETVIATVEFRDPSGIIISTHTQTWNGFPENNNPGNLDNDPTTVQQVLFQVPWSEDNKWDAGPDNLPGTVDDNKWTVVARVSGAPLESDLTDNEVSHQFSLTIPNLAMSGDLAISATDPTSGALGSNFYPNSEITVSGNVQNSSLARTQEGIIVPITVRLIDEASGNVVDEEITVIPDPNQSPVSIAGNQIVPFTVDNLHIPEDADFDANYTVEVVVDEQPNPAIPSPGIMPEGIEDHVVDPTDNRAQGSVNITRGSSTLTVDPDSFRGDIGSYSGLDPIRIAFSVRNVGPVAVQPTENYTARVMLSEDDTSSNDDFILREFDLGGTALGTNLLPNETIGLDWVQQLPDNLEGDYYLVVNLQDKFLRDCQYG